MIVNKNWKFVRSNQEFGVVIVLFFLCQTLGCWSLSEEDVLLMDAGLALLRLKEEVVNDPFDALWDWKKGDGEVDHCSWFGVQCTDDGKVVVLNLKDLYLEGTLAPELGNLAHIKSINLRNNCFTGKIPEGIGELKELEVLDLGYNNLSGLVPPQLGSNLSLTVLLVDNNELLDQPSEATKSTCNQRQLGQSKYVAQRKLMHKMPAMPPKARLLFNGYSPARRGRNSPPSFNSSTNRTSARDPQKKQRSTTLARSPSEKKVSPNASAPSHSSSHNQTAILAGAIGGTICLLILIAIAYLFKTSKVSPVKPWKTGLSGKLQKAFVTGVPKLKRSELEAACEDFSNVIASSTIGTVYKGTLSNGVEIAVASFPAKSAKDWSKNMETQFRNKIDTLSKVNHKNFVNLLGYCEETKPFTRMMVFEYAPNGTLFEHLHIQESEHLDWMARLRIIMGMAYCLEHMHQLNPPTLQKNISSSAVVLTEDYAAKISDPCFTNLSDTPPATLGSNVYTFGVLLFEMVTGRMPYMVDNGSLDDWASQYLRNEQALVEMIDPTLKSFDKKQVEDIGEVIQACVHHEPGRRPNMREVSTRLREITAITPDGATPKLSPLWWAELEIMSAEAS
ncbi:inactive receptor-like serine/threonine-protein kinase At2g40270 isoform X1 [Hibiscus syriacus]|uniref:inactive receptor-like serine/threonine-protein kinase At2g40270 isoform X1 n=1 Tax=Hibiscus syriacus TaxID=106335 RepID=UPI0019220278|nr:inactive receptor-like serine/threonine-protein kinase At2g40270 isoform X1 [Hibiscus syriacus]